MGDALARHGLEHSTEQVEVGVGVVGLPTRPIEGLGLEMRCEASRTNATTSSRGTGDRVAMVRVHSRTRRISTRGNPSRTESVSATLVKPACSNSDRVPT